MTDQQTVMTAHDRLVAELENQEGQAFRHTRQTETRLRDLWNDIPRSEVNEALQDRVNHILDMVLSEGDHTDDRSSESRSSFTPEDNQVHKALETKLTQLSDYLLNSAFVYQLARLQHNGCISLLNKINGPQEFIENIKSTLVAIDGAIEDRKMAVQQTTNPVYLTPHPTPTPPANPTYQVKFLRERKVPVFSGKIEEYPDWEKMFNDHLEEGEYNTEGSRYLALQEAVADTCDAREAVKKWSTAAQALEDLRCRYSKPKLLIFKFIKKLVNWKQIAEDDLQGYRALLEDIKQQEKYITNHNQEGIMLEGIFIAVLTHTLPYKRRKDFKLDDTYMSNREKGEYFRSQLPIKLGELNERLGPMESAGGKHKMSVNVVSTPTPRPAPQADRPTPNYKCNYPGCGKTGEHWTRHCEGWRSLAPKDRGDMVVKQNWCAMCLGPRHIGKYCPLDWWEACKGCGKKHSSGLCELEIGPIPGLFVNSANTQGHKALLCAETVKVKGAGKMGEGEVDILYDSGANVSIVGEDWAVEQELEAVGESSEREVQLALGGRVQVTTQMYKIPLLDGEGKVHVVNALSFPEPVAAIHNNERSLAAAEEEFGLGKGSVGRTGKVAQLLLGTDNTAYLPVMIREKKNLRLMRTKFGLVVAGVVEEDNGGGGVVNSVKAYEEGFLSLEALGTDAPRRCMRCTTCSECEFKAVQMSHQHSKECERMKEGLKLDEEVGVWTCEYPLQRDLADLPNNKYQVIKAADRMEKRLEREGKLQEFNGAFEEGLGRGVYRLLTQEEEENWNGPVHYTLLTESYKEGPQATTPIRVCSNSSLSYKGTSLNDFLIRGPSTINNILAVTLGFRFHEVGFTRDIRKFYQCIRSTPRDQHIRRVIWGKDEKGRPRTYVHTTLAFGDSCAGSSAQLALEMTAEKYGQNKDEAVKALISQTYVDDIASGGKTEVEVEKVSRDIDEILEKGGFSAKPLHRTGQDGQIAVLGMMWDKKTDQLFVPLRFNTSARRKGIHLQQDTPLDALGNNFPPTLTRRQIWRIVQSQYDPLGLLAPLTLRLKLLLRAVAIADPGGAWDSEIGGDLVEQCRDVCAQFVLARQVPFPRKVVGEGEALELLIFADASCVALAAAVYVRVESGDGFSCRLLCARTKVAPARQTTIPRLELTAAVMAVRLAQVVKRAMPVQPSGAWYFTDSSAVLGKLKSSAGSDEVYEAIRLAEIQDKSCVTRWLWVPGHANPADWLTRATLRVQDMGESSLYQTGMAWMSTQRENWPTRSSFSAEGEIEEPATVTALSVIHADPPARRNTLPILGTWQATLNTACAVARFIQFTRRSGARRKPHTNTTTNTTETAQSTAPKGGGPDGGREDAQHENTSLADLQATAVQLLAREAQKETIELVSNGGLSSYRPHLVKINGYETGVWSAQLRDMPCEGAYTPLVDKDSKIAKLWMKHVHDQSHDGVAATYARSRRLLVIVRGKLLAKATIKSCTRCKINNKKFLQPVMAPLPVERMSFDYTWAAINLDVAGPFHVTEVVNRRTTRKLWIAVFVCSCTMAIHTELLDGYGTQELIGGVTRFVAMRTLPRTIVSDRGTNMVGTRNALESWCRDNGVQWDLIPTRSPWSNGTAERAIGLIKKHLRPVLSAQRLTVFEFMTATVTITSALNARPIGVFSKTEDNLNPLTPSMFMNAAPTPAMPPGPSVEAKLSTRAATLATVFTKLKKRIQAEVLNDRAQTWKWNHAGANDSKLSVGQLVAFFETANQNEYKLATVTDIKLDRDGTPRSAKIRHKVGKAYKETTRSARCLIVL